MIHVTAMNRQASNLSQTINPGLSWEMLSPIVAEPRKELETFKTQTDPTGQLLHKATLL